MKTTGCKTIRSRCPICGGVIESRMLEHDHGGDVITTCEYCGSLVIVEVEGRNNGPDTAGRDK